MEILSLRTLTRDRATEIIKGLNAELEGGYTMRVARPDDIPGIIKADERAWEGEEVGEESLSMTKEMIGARLGRFSIGTWVLISPEKRISGSICTMLINDDPAKITSWENITSSGVISNHIFSGNVLFGVNFSVDPEARGSGGEFLKTFSQIMVVGLGLKRGLAGGRLSGYIEFADKMSIDDYIYSIAPANNFYPLDLSMAILLSVGWKVVKIIPSYWSKDKKSSGYGVLMGWDNPYLGIL